MIDSLRQEVERRLRVEAHIDDERVTDVVVEMIERERNLFLAAAKDLHDAAKHPGVFADCTKHKCVHLRESMRQK